MQHTIMHIFLLAASAVLFVCLCLIGRLLMNHLPGAANYAPIFLFFVSSGLLTILIYYLLPIATFGWLHKVHTVLLAFRDATWLFRLASTIVFLFSCYSLLTYMYRRIFIRTREAQPIQDEVLVLEEEQPIQANAHLDQEQAAFEFFWNIDLLGDGSMHPAGGKIRPPELGDVIPAMGEVMQRFAQKFTELAFHNPRDNDNRHTPPQLPIRKQLFYFLRQRFEHPDQIKPVTSEDGDLPDNKGLSELWLLWNEVIARKMCDENLQQDIQRQIADSLRKVICKLRDKQVIISEGCIEMEIATEDLEDRQKLKCAILEDHDLFQNIADKIRQAAQQAVQEIFVNHLHQPVEQSEVQACLSLLADLTNINLCGRASGLKNSGPVKMWICTDTQLNPAPPEAPEKENFLDVLEQSYGVPAGIMQVVGNRQHTKPRLDLQLILDKAEAMCNRATGNRAESRLNMIIAAQTLMGHPRWDASLEQEINRLIPDDATFVEGCRQVFQEFSCRCSTCRAFFADFMVYARQRAANVGRLQEVNNSYAAWRGV